MALARLRHDRAGLRRPPPCRPPLGGRRRRAHRRPTGGLVVNVGAGPARTNRRTVPSSPWSRPASWWPAPRRCRPRRCGPAPSALPLPSGCADVALAILTVHHWDDWAAGLAELCRVAPRRVVLAIDFELHSHFWLLEEYLPEVGEYTRRCGPRPTTSRRPSGPRRRSRSSSRATWWTACSAPYWCRPEAYLDPAVRANCSGLALADPAVVARAIGRLEADLASGAWQQRHADLAELDSVDIGYRLLVATRPDPTPVVLPDRRRGRPGRCPMAGRARRADRARRPARLRPPPPGTVAGARAGRSRWLRKRLWNPQSRRPFSWVVAPPCA